MPGTIIKIINVTINYSNYHWEFSVKYILKLYISIITSQSCQHCQIETLSSIQRTSIPVNIQQQDGLSIIVEIYKPIVSIITILNGITTTSGNSSF
jgi:hypothetical protein